ncbi:hypothetical protein DFH05DRAFT_1391946 [Lentinula detonsa]|uniref:Uncharacterized protein n=1 Tax=Lentinula detonsa TaxID=2804962 RepID=A0A9W8P4W8_9AGAR|nr:hypothetical protein DFH05DRAFT_1391946 [Lentinula detonsa]
MTFETEDSHIFYHWLAMVIEFACYGYRNQRVSHPGHMAQVALTLGARHIPASDCEVGWGVSYYKKLSNEVKISHDEDVIAASGIFWSMIMSTMPAEVTQPMVEILSDQKVPHMATRWIAPGKGFHLQLENRHYVFPNVNCSPPELFLTKGYLAYVIIFILSALV